MGSRGGKVAETLETLGVAPDVIQKLTDAVYQKEEALARDTLTKCFKRLNVVLGRDDKAKKDSLSDLALKVCSLADMIAGMYEAEVRDKEAIKNCLNDTLRPIRKALKERCKGDASIDVEDSRTAFQAAIDATYRIKLQGIINEALNRNIEEGKK